MQVRPLNERHLILFDLDGTLIDTAADMYRAMNAALTKLALPLVTEPQIRQWVGKGTAKLCDSVLLHLAGTIDAVQHQQLLACYLQCYTEGLCISSQPFAGVLAFLNYCQAQQLHMACVTNKPEALAKQLLQQLQLDHYFGLILGGDSLPVRKPDPLPLLHAAAFFNCSPEQTLMIGDSSNDIEAARNARIDCIVMSYGYNHGEDIYACHPQQVIDTLETLIPS
ncbi:phosphoglycolate phosphatase [Acinetobacter sp. MD2(2019)]|uniref:phosphoglycolate phosphatase n=1 Tax=Acinetobacter sp. MD2(2019) TaxID=2605273 RepID=UPI002D1EB510|nr:phosphoglycolate phosphatase [Acinetobacter sp. MD2(2019)]MEB3754466.1 phosphoglycolate phosphatase [Acinetobacter sp. MD2(2019)]